MHSLLFLALLTSVTCLNFPYESTQLQDEDISAFPAISFGDNATPSNPSACKAFPGNPDWLINEDWSKLNRSLNGALLKPRPVASVCYNGNTAASCTSLLQNAFNSRFYIDDPLTVFTEWPEGDTCSAILNPQGNCTQGRFPVYIVNATTVKQIQIAVNFARNRNIRLVIKNTGHEWVGRSVGAGSLSIWTHWLKRFEYLPEYSQGEYKGRAARVGPGLEAWELYPLMDQYDMAVVAPAGSSTVGVYGGFMAGGGHSVLASYYGLGSDQALSLQVVTADGRFVTADPDTNEDLFYALRGGGPSTYGIITSAIVKAYPRLNVGMARLNFNYGPTVPPNSTITITTDLETFWAGVNKFFFYGKHITQLGGTSFSNVALGFNNSTLTFTNTFELPGMSPQAVISAVQPLFDDLNTLGIPVSPAIPLASLLWAPSLDSGKGDTPGNSRFTSRLFPRENWDNTTIFAATMAPIRASVEAGYRFHGIHMAPTSDIAGYPGGAAVNPAFRQTYMHADLFDNVQLHALSTEMWKETHARLGGFMDKIREVTKGGGAYVNEAGVLEPGWQRSFYGGEYGRLVGIKGVRDPWGVFWATGTPGSEAWEVRGTEGLPTQNGMLCRTGK